MHASPFSTKSTDPGILAKNGAKFDIFMLVNVQETISLRKKDRASCLPTFSNFVTFLALSLS
jgi:hypothetical protein